MTTLSGCGSARRVVTTVAAPRRLAVRVTHREALLPKEHSRMRDAEPREHVLQGRRERDAAGGDAAAIGRAVAAVAVAIAAVATAAVAIAGAIVIVGVVPGKLSSIGAKHRTCERRGQDGGGRREVGGRGGALLAPFPRSPRSHDERATVAWERRISRRRARLDVVWRGEVSAGTP